MIATLDGLDFDERQKLLRLVLEEVRVTGWNVEIRLRIPLDAKPDGSVPDGSPPGQASRSESVSTNDRLRSLGRYGG